MGSVSINFSKSLLKNPIIVPLNAVIISVPTPTPTNFLKKISVIRQAAARQEKSKQVLNFESFILYLLLTPLTKKSYTCG